MPEPDVVFVQRPLSRYSQGHPVTADVMLLVEVSDTAYRYDRYVKLPLYARAGVPEAWIIDLNHDVVEVFRDPLPTGYASMQRMERGETVAALAFPDVVLEVAEILPPSP
jgi:Uma2 family endonuclease